MICNELEDEGVVRTMHVVGVLRVVAELDVHGSWKSVVGEPKVVKLVEVVVGTTVLLGIEVVDTSKPKKTIRMETWESNRRLTLGVNCRCDSES